VTFGQVNQSRANLADSATRNSKCIRFLDLRVAFKVVIAGSIKYVKNTKKFLQVFVFANFILK